MNCYILHVLLCNCPETKDLCAATVGYNMPILVKLQLSFNTSMSGNTSKILSNPLVKACPKINVTR
jgi:hypothetical protein